MEIKIYELLENKVRKLESNDDKMLGLLKTNKKINILEQSISYLEGRKRK